MSIYIYICVCVCVSNHGDQPQKGRTPVPSPSGRPFPPLALEPGVPKCTVVCTGMNTAFTCVYIHRLSIAPMVLTVGSDRRLFLCLVGGGLVGVCTFVCACCLRLVLVACVCVFCLWSCK